MKDGELRRWFRTSDVKANACEVIHKVELPSNQTGAVSDMDLTSSSLEEMFQIHPSVVSGGSHFTHPSVVSGRSHFTHPSVVSGRSHFTHATVVSGRSHFTHATVVSGRSCFTHCSVL